MLWRLFSRKLEVISLDIIKLSFIFILIHLMEIAFFILPFSLSHIYLSSTIQNTADVLISIISKILVVHFLLKWFTSDVESENSYVANWFLNLLLSIIALIGFRLIYDQTLAHLLTSLFDSSSITQAVDSAFGNPYIGFLLIVIITPIYEEILYRGILFKGICKHYTPFVGIIISSILFAVMHFNIIQSAHALFLGILLAYIYHHTESLTITTLVHISNNILVLFLPFSAFELFTGKYLIVLAPIFFILGLILFIPSIMKIKKATH